jgi:hypothetical protein
MKHTRALLWGALGTALLGVTALPAARVPILGDDFQALFEVYATADGSPFKALISGWRAGTTAGHFNPFGQALGYLHHFNAYAFSTNLGLPPQLYDVVVGAVLLWLTVLAATTVLVHGLRYADLAPDLGFWRSFALLAAVTAVTLQLHPWSNDPVTSYTMAGWGSAVIGFALLGQALRSTTPGRSSRADVAVVGAVSVFAVLYYEMLVGVIAGTAVVYAATLVRSRRRGERDQARRALLLGAVGVVLPAVVFVAGRLLAIPSDQSTYTGTAISLGTDALWTWLVAMVGAVPVGGWEYLVQSGGGVPLTRWAALFTLAVAIGLLAFLSAWRRTPLLVGRWSRSALVPITAVAVTWAVTTATHATSVKYIAEIKSPGQVYLYYAVGAICVALLLAGAFITLAPRLRRGMRTAAALALGAYLTVQLPLNWHLAHVSAAAYANNRNLSGAATDDQVPEATRCDTLLAWAQAPWPQYYREAVVRGAQEDFQRVFGEPLCSDPTRLAQLEFMVTG